VLRHPVPAYVIHYDAPDWCASTVNSLMRSRGIDVEVTVVNNGGSPLHLPPQVPIVETGRNLGYTGAANVALRSWFSGGSEFGIVACHDVDVAEDALATMLAALRAHPEFGILAPTLTDGRKEGLSTDDVVERDWAAGTLLLFRRVCIESIGMFDERFGSYVEDVELGHRARAAGWKVGVAPRAKATQHGASSPLAQSMTAANYILLKVFSSKGWRRQAARSRLLYMCGRAAIEGASWHDSERRRSARGALRVRTRALRASFRPDPPSFKDMVRH
jgi:N-acetylglucosaminyl-diphospho-decaprenol L-rhamnosyltransferase